MRALARRFGRASMASAKSAAKEALATARKHPIVSAVAIGAAAGTIAGAAGVLPGAVIGGAAAIGVERLVKG